MIQKGSPMVDSDGQASFGTKSLEAFNFYLQFADPSSDYYTWNDNIDNSLNLFSQGDLAIMFNYQSAVQIIKEKNPYLSFGASLMPQFDTGRPMNYSDYWGLAVSAQSANKVASWNFVVSATADPKVSEAYLGANGKPPALRSLIDKYKNDPSLGVFAKQALTAKSWSQPDSNGVKQILSDMIESVINGKLSSDKALGQAVNQILSLSQ